VSTSLQHEIDEEVPSPQPVCLELKAEEVESKESRRETLRRLDELLEMLERANLADLSNPPPGAIRELRSRGLPNPPAHSIPDLIEIVFDAQRPLMEANRDAWRVEARSSGAAEAGSARSRSGR
jgi:hypothetical protein